MLSQVSLAHRVLHEEASHPAHQTRLPGVKWLCWHLSLEGWVQSHCPEHCDSRWHRGVECRDAETSTTIWSHRQHSWASPMRTPPAPSWQESHSAALWRVFRGNSPLEHNLLDEPHLAEGLPRWLSSKYPACQCRTLTLTPGSGRSPGAGHGNSLQYSCLGNPIDRGSWQAAIHEPQRVGHDWVTGRAHTHTRTPLEEEPPPPVEGRGVSLQRTGNKIGRNQPVSVFPGGSDGKESACSAGDPSLIPGLGRFPGDGNGYPLQYSCLENSMEFSWAIVHEVAKSDNWATYTFSHFLAKKAAAI